MASKSKIHPENLKDVNEVEVTGDVIDFINETKSDIEDTLGQRSQWEMAVDRLNRLRYGVKRRKNHPWVGAANYSIPVIDSKIERMKPAYINLAYSVSPVVTFEPYGPEDVEPARNKEYLFDWRLRTKVKFFEPYAIGVDQVLGPMGMTVFRNVWKFKSRSYQETIDLNDLSEQEIEAIFDPRVTDEFLEKMIVEELGVDLSYEENEREVKKAVDALRKGKIKIDLDLMEDAEDRVEVIACDVNRDLAVPLDTKDINDARFIDYKFWVTKNDLKISMEDGKYNKFGDEQLDSWAGKDQTKDTVKNQNVSDEMVLLHETCVWYDANNDGIKERCIATWPDSDPASILRFIELPYDHGQWPYVQVKRELIDYWFYSTRGIPSLDEDFQTGISTAVNQAIDNGTLVNMPERVARKGLISNPRNRRFLPGEFTEVNGSPSEYETRVIPNISQPGLFQQAQFLKGWSDARSGQVSNNFSDPTQLGGQGGGGKKTKAEIEAIGASQNEARSLELMVFQQQMAKVYFQIDALYEQYGPEEETIMITGKTPVTVSRGEIQGKFNIIPNGRLDNATPGQRLQKKMFAFQVGAQNPFIRQFDLLKEIFEDIDPRLAQLVVKTEEEIAKEQQQAQQLQQQLQAEAIQTQVGLKKVSDDLDIRKTILETPITGRQFAPD